MSKKNITQINSNSELLNPIKPINVDAVNYLGWFISDVQNVRNWTGQLSNNDVDLNNSKVFELKTAAENALSEIEDDVVKIKAFLAEYVPPNK